MSSYRIPGPVDAGFLLTAIPGLLGYIPAPSVTVLGFQHGTLEATMRYDLDLDDDLTPRPAMIGALRQAGAIVNHYQPDELLMVINDGRAALDDRRYRRIFGIADRACREVGGIRAGFVVAAYAEGARWHRIWQPAGSPRVLRAAPPHTPETDCHGVLGDPYSSPIAVSEAVRKGRRLLDSRGEMDMMLTPQEHCVDADCDYTGQVLEPCSAADRALWGGFDERAAAVQESVEVVNARIDAVIETVKLFVTQSTTPQPLTCALLRRLEWGLLNPTVRDISLALALSEARPGAEVMWRGLTRRLGGSGRASAATMLAHLHYALGEGAYAAVALDTALRADPQWSLAGLLDTALRNGVPPSCLSETIEYSHRIAELLGIDLPPTALDLDIAG